MTASCSHPAPTFNDPGKEFEVQLIGPDLNQLAELEQQITQQIKGYLESECARLLLAF